MLSAHICVFSTSFSRKSHNWCISQSYVEVLLGIVFTCSSSKNPRPGGLPDVNLCVPGSTTSSRTKYGNQQPFSHVWVKYDSFSPNSDTLQILILSRHPYFPMGLGWRCIPEYHQHTYTSAKVTDDLSQYLQLCLGTE